MANGRPFGNVDWDEQKRQQQQELENSNFRALTEALTSPVRSVKEAYPTKDEVKQWMDSLPPNRLGPIGEAVINAGDDTARFLGGMIPSTGEALEEELLMSLIPLGKFGDLGDEVLDATQALDKKAASDFKDLWFNKLQKSEGNEIIDEVLDESQSSGSGFKLVDGPEPPQITYDDLSSTQKQSYDNLSDKQKAQYSPSDINAMYPKANEPVLSSLEGLDLDNFSPPFKPSTPKPFPESKIINTESTLDQIKKEYGDGSQYNAQPEILNDLPRQLDIANQEMDMLYNTNTGLSQQPLSYSARPNIDFTPEQEEIWSFIPNQLKDQMNNAWQFFDELPGDITMGELNPNSLARIVENQFPDLSKGAVNAITYNAMRYGKLGDY